MINVYVHCANAQDATSWYRAWGTFADIEKRSDIRFYSMDLIFRTMTTEMKKEAGRNPKEKISFLFWPELIKADVAFFQRSTEGPTLAMAKDLKKAGVKIWYDLDDNLWEIPQTYQVKKHFYPAILDNVKEFLRLADVVTVSTKALADYLERFDVKAKVINNGIDFDKYPIRPINLAGKTIWRGSSTHADDLNKFRELFERMEEVTFFGFDPIRNYPRLKANGKFIPAANPSHYYHALKHLEPTFLISTLSDNIFNQCKSNISYMEATMAGAVSVNTQVGEFKSKGIDINETEVSADLILTKHAEAVEDCLDNYHLKKLNDQRIEMICGLL